MTPNDVIGDHEVQNGVHNAHTVHDIHDKRVVEIVEEDNNLLVDQITSTVWGKPKKIYISSQKQLP